MTAPQKVTAAEKGKEAMKSRELPPPPFSVTKPVVDELLVGVHWVTDEPGG